MNEDAITQRLDAMDERFRALEAQLSDPDVTRDHQRVAELSRERASLAPVVTRYREHRRAVDEAAALRGMIEQESDAEIRHLAGEELPKVEAKAAALLEALKGDLVTSDDRAVGAVILEVRAGVGGDEAAIWAGDLLGMYERFATEHAWKWETIELSSAERGGCKNAIVSVRGSGVWQHLGYEGGTHCVKRVPETEAQGRIHTSTATVAVLPEPGEVDIHIPEEDVKIDVTTARGPGGQNVNKVATAVKMLHIPTGIEVRMQDTKSQHQNRALAWQVLRARVHEHYQKLADARRSETRNKMIGRGDRSERIRTYRWKENLVVDHRVNQSFNLQEVIGGRLDPVVRSLIEHDTAQRLAAL